MLVQPMKALIGRPSFDFKRLRHRVIRAMRQVVAVDDQQRSLGRSRHPHTIIADTMHSMPGRLLLRGGHVYTFDPRQPTASRHCRTRGADPGALARTWTSSWRRAPAPSSSVVARSCPGFVDAHIHFGFFALSLAAGRPGRGARRSRAGLALLRGAADRLAPERLAARPRLGPQSLGSTANGDRPRHGHRRSAGGVVESRRPLAVAQQRRHACGGADAPRRNRQPVG